MGIIQRSVSTLEKYMGGIPLAASLYSRPYKKVVEKEVHLAGIKATDRVLNIGCGAVPFTAVYLARLTGAMVLAQDRDPGAVAKALICLRNFRMQDRVEVLEGDSACFVPGGFDVAIVALQAAPKAAILNNLLAAMNPGARMVFRLPAPQFVKYYDILPQGVATLAEVRHNMQTLDASVLLEKPRHG